MPRPRLDYRDPATLQPFLDPRGRIQSRRATKLCAADQRLLARQVKLARELGLLPSPPHDRPVKIKGITGADGRPVPKGKKR